MLDACRQLAKGSVIFGDEEKRIVAKAAAAAALAIVPAPVPATLDAETARIEAGRSLATARRAKARAWVSLSA